MEFRNEEILRALSVMRPPVVFLHELTHLLLRVEFILEEPDLSRWMPEEIRDRNSFFESAYSRYIMRWLLRIHLKFQIFMLPEVDPDCCTCFCRRYTQERANAEALVRRCGICWGGIDEIFVIMGVRLMLEGKEHVLGETILLRKLAALHQLPTNFVCWSHQLIFLPVPGDPESRIEPPRESDLFPHLFFQHREAFMALCHYLGWGEGMEEEVPVADDLATAKAAEGLEDIPPTPPSEEEWWRQAGAVATGPIPVFPEV
ncbi:MAG: hypothetical protein LBD40_04185 [Puniceicoccales bacterium]|nr:hypothetical protein [Puniceicoccales bacterium]